MVECPRLCRDPTFTATLSYRCVRSLEGDFQVQSGGGHPPSFRAEATFLLVLLFSSILTILFILLNFVSYIAHPNPGNLKALKLHYLPLDAVIFP